MLYNVVFSHLHDVTIYYIFNETMSNTFDPIRRQIQYFYLGTPSTWSLRLIFNYAIELGTKTNLETLTLFVFPPIDLPLGHFEMRKEDRVLGSNFVIFLFGLGLGYVMACDGTIVCVYVHSVVLIKDSG